jgi:hypothetical protein
METTRSHHRGRVVIAGAAVVLVVAGSLWWTKTIAFTSTSVVQFSIDPFEAPDDSRSQTFIAAANFPYELPSTGERLAQNLGGNASDFESDLAITASDAPGLAVTARGRTPSAARTLATDAAAALRSILEELNTMDILAITFTVIPPTT